MVARRNWVDRQHFLDMVGATNLIPGPNAVEMAIHIGYKRGRIIGAFVGGISFMFTSVMLTGLLAYFYLLYGSLPSVEPFLYGIKPAVIIIILNAVFKLGVKAVKREETYLSVKLIIIAGIVAFLNFYGLNEIYSILAGGVFGALFLIGFPGKYKIKCLLSFNSASAGTLEQYSTGNRENSCLTF